MISSRPTVYIHPFAIENYEKLISSSTPGVRTILLMVTETSKHKLLQKFAEVVLPYSRSDTINYLISFCFRYIFIFFFHLKYLLLLFFFCFSSDAFCFSFLQIEDHIPWFRHLLEETIEFKRDLDTIQATNCIGTVLAINGRRKYYSIYHAHQPNASKRYKKPSHLHGALGLDEFSDDSDKEESGDSECELDADKLFQADLLNGLDQWLARLCEGTLKRFRIEYWPSLQSSS